MFGLDANENNKALLACKTLLQINNTGYVDIKGGCANAKDDSTDQAKREAVWVANAQVRRIQNQMNQQWSGECGALMSRPNIRVSRTPPGVLLLPPANALSTFPTLARLNRVEVKIGTP
jgi:hypothetical protein